MHPICTCFPFDDKAINRINDSLMSFEALLKHFRASNKSTLIFAQENAFGNVVCTMPAFWYRHKCATSTRFSGLMLHPLSFNNPALVKMMAWLGRQSIIRTNDGLVYWRIYESLGRNAYDVLSNPLDKTRCPKIYLLSSHKNVLTSKRFPPYCPLVGWNPPVTSGLPL